MRLGCAVATILVFGQGMAAPALLAEVAIAEESGVVIAGTQPDRRPDNAPVIQQFEKPGDWYGQTLQGIEQPYPYSLRFLEDQGAWYTPFNHPGMTGRYDIRGLHQK